MDYKTFLDSKKHSSSDYGIDPKYFPDNMFDFQRHVTEYAVKKGKCAIFLDTGLGKTLIELTIASNFVRSTNKPVLIITPLAVAYQFIKEANTFGIDDVEYSKDGTFKAKIVICNYERLHYFNSSYFDCVILDESSILKNFNGAIKTQITSFLKKVKYRFLATATPSPNDFIELGTSSEALGYMGYMDMLGKFFKNNQNDTGGRVNIGSKFYLKPHAETDFFTWVNQWSIIVKMPSDIGFSNDGYILPNLNINKHTITNNSLIDVNGQMQLYNIVAKTMTEVRDEQKATIAQRCEKAVGLAAGKVSVYWCNLNEESSLLHELDPDAMEIQGSMSVDKKEDILMNFAEGNIDRIITKAKMTGLGLNWQHCNHSVFFPTWSYEQYYQAIRRFWRFGQKRDVNIDIVISDGMQRVLQTIEEKTAKAIELHSQLLKNTNGIFEYKKKEAIDNIIKPNFLN